MYTQNIKALRAVKGLRQEDLAKFLGISLNSYNNKENGKREFSLMEANSLAKLFVEDKITLEQAKAQIEEKNIEILNRTIMQLKIRRDTRM